MREKISVVIPTYNRAAYIERTVRSVLDQSYQPLELIVVDDGSTDDTASVLEQFAAAPGFVYHYQPNCGRSVARNNGAAMATGEWIMYLDSDDLLLPDALEKLSRKIAGDPSTEFIVANFSFFRKGYPAFDLGKSFDREMFQPNFLLELFEDRYCFTKTGTYLVKRSIDNATGGFDRQYEPCEDLDYAIRMLSRAKVSISTDNILLVERHEGNTDKKEMLIAMVKIFQHYLSQRDTWQATLAPRYHQRAIAAMKLRIANWLYELDNHRAAFDYYFGAVRARPSLLKKRFVAKQLLASLWLPTALKKKIRRKAHPSNYL